MITLLLIITPLIFSLFVFFIRNEYAAKRFSLFSSLTVFCLAVIALVVMKYGCHCQLRAQSGWFSDFGVSLRIGLDGTGLLLVLMTTLLVPVIILSTFRRTIPGAGAFYGLILLMESALVGVFAVYDGMLFYIFWEMALIPAWFICALWGGDDRIRITFKFFIYTFTGSLFMLVALIWVFLKTPAPHSFGWEVMTSAILSRTEQNWIFAAFFLAFAIKIPIIPFHTWQPDTYTGSPAAGTMLLAGIMLKMGLFGIIRWLIPLTPAVIPVWMNAGIGLGVAGVVYGSVIAIRQQDLKRLVAWSSIAHVGLIAAGIFALNLRATQGAVIQMVSHGVNVVGLFFIIDIIEQNTGTRIISNLGGIARHAPKLAVFFMIILLGSIALPLTNGFTGEFLILLGLFEAYPLAAGLAGLTIILGAVYMLWMYQRVMLGKSNELTGNISDLTTTEIIALIPLTIMVFWVGIYPSFFLGML